MNEAAVQEKRKKRPRIGDAQRVRNRMSELNNKDAFLNSKEASEKARDFIKDKKDEGHAHNLSIMKESIADYRRDIKAGTDSSDAISLRLQRRLRLVLDRVEASGYKSFVKEVKENLKQQLLTGKEEFFDNVDKAVAGELEKFCPEKKKAAGENNNTNKKVIFSTPVKEVSSKY